MIFMRVCVRFFLVVPFNIHILAALHLTFFAAHNSPPIRLQDNFTVYLEESNEQKECVSSVVCLFVGWSRCFLYRIAYAIESMLIVGASNRTFFFDDDDDDSHKTKRKIQRKKKKRKKKVVKRLLRSILVRCIQWIKLTFQ